MTSVWKTAPKAIPLNFRELMDEELAIKIQKEEEGVTTAISTEENIVDDDLTLAIKLSQLEQNPNINNNSGLTNLTEIITEAKQEDADRLLALHLQKEMEGEVIKQKQSQTPPKKEKKM